MPRGKPRTGPRRDPAKRRSDSSKRGDPANPRACAARVLARVLAGASLNNALPAELHTLKTARAQVQAWCYGVLRDYHRLQGLLAPLLKQPFKPRDRDIEGLLLLGLYQLFDSHTAAHAAIAETVEATRALGKDWASGLVNAILRRVQREQAELAARSAADECMQYAHPDWLLDALRRDWPEDWPAIVAANNSAPPMTLRVNARVQDRDAYLQQLAAAGHAAAAEPLTDVAITLAKPCDVDALPGFATGAVSVQDAGAQLAAVLLAAQPGERILDACAAPGGKTGHILERQPALAELVALDSAPERLARVTENLQRLGLSATLIEGDATQPATWWDDQTFDRILLDAPCSATGVIRRHPDIKLLRRADDIDALAATQRAMLSALWPLLRPGGMLLYATCSVLRRENEETVTQFLHAHSDAAPEPLSDVAGTACAVGRQLLPGAGSGTDGFYYALLRKSA